MSSDDREIMIEVRGLGKAYSIASSEASHTSMAEAVMNRVRTPFKREKPKETFWALQDLDFDVKRGDVMGVVGRNGAGKSTLFKVLSRVTEPTAGKAKLYGRVGSLLEVGTGFSGELTGRENIFLNGTILGMRRAEIAKRFDEIVDFAGVERFLETPVKRYSSGMYVRLAFAVAAHLDPEILIVDEVLSVGDAEFQKKCLGRIGEIARSGRTVLFVSHNMPSVQQLCTTAIVMRSGRLIATGSVDDAIAAYSAEYDTSDEEAANPSIRPGSGEHRFARVRPSASQFDPDEPKTFDLRIERHGERVSGIFFTLTVRDVQGRLAAHCDGRLTDAWIGSDDSSNYRVVLRSPWLLPGRYSVDVALATTLTPVDFYERACFFDVNTNIPFNVTTSNPSSSESGILSDFSIEQS